MANLLLTSPDGDATRAGWKGRPPVSQAAVAVRATGRFAVVVTGSGTGPYRLTKRVTEPRRLTDISRGEIKSGPEVWRFSAEKGQDLAFLISSPTLRWRVTLEGADGKRIGYLAAEGGTDDDLLRIKIPAHGDYTLRVESADASVGTYQIKRIDLSR